MRAVDPALQRAATVVLPRILVEFDPLDAEPHEIGITHGPGAALEEASLPQHRDARAQAEQFAHVIRSRTVGVLPVQRPGVADGDVHGDAVGVVVAVLRVPELVAGEQHRCARRQQQRREHRPDVPVAGGEDLRIVGRPFDPVVHRLVVVRPVPALLTVLVVVLALVRDRIGEGETVVGGDEVDRHPRLPDVPVVEVLRTGEPRSHLADPGTSRPVTADRVAVAVVPFGPLRAEVPELVTVCGGVPRFGDELDVAEDGIGDDRGEQCRSRIEGPTAGTGQRTGEVEAEAVHPHHVRPVPEAVAHHPHDDR